MEIKGKGECEYFKEVRVTKHSFLIKSNSVDYAVVHLFIVLEKIVL
jgi:hypothetical protein